MTKHTKPFAQSFAELPNTLAIFPLTNALMLPGGELPLNIFEPRYLNMVQDAMKTSQLIGMIQPALDSESDDSTTGLCQIGSAGRIVRYEETVDGRLSIELTGLCRFNIKEELSSVRGYRLIVPDWSNFEHDYDLDNDLQAGADNPQTKLQLYSALRQHFKHNDIEVNWQLLESLSLKELMTSLFNYLPLRSRDKQKLLETHSFTEQLTIFTAILENKSKPSSTLH